MPMFHVRAEFEVRPDDPYPAYDRAKHPAELDLTVGSTFDAENPVDAAKKFADQAGALVAGALGDD